MAVTLPTLTVTDDQAQRILAAFGSEADYLRWLTEQVNGVVLTAEARMLDEASNEAKRVALADLEATLPDPEAVV